jgi:hypothetical protein
MNRNLWPINVVALEYPHEVSVNVVNIGTWREMKHWCQQHFNDAHMDFFFDSGPSVFLFKHERDAVLFMLRWL